MSLTAKHWMNTRLRVLLAMVLVLPGVVVSPTKAAGAPTDEFALKAAFLFNFTRFVEWPESAFASSEDPFRVCVIGEDPFGHRLVALGQRRVGDRAIRVEYPRTVDALARCQMAYIGEATPAELRRAAMQRDPSTLLTVSSDGSFVRQGGMVALVTDGGRIRLHINLVAIRSSPLRFSAKLLEIAQVRHGDAGPQL